MKIRFKKTCRAAILSLACLLSAVFLAASAQAQESPPGCTGCGVGVNITRDPAIVESGTPATFTVTVSNDLPGSCDIQDATVTLYCPGPNGAPDLSNGIVLATDLDLAWGQGVSLTFPPEACTITTNPGVLFAQARVIVSGPPGSCRLSPIDTADGAATATVGVRHTCVEITKECVNECTPYGQPILFRGRITNCSDQPVVILSLTDVPAANITLVGGGDPVGQQIAAGAFVDYVGSYTPTGDLCGPFPDTITVVVRGVEVATEVQDSASALCHVQTNPALTITKVCEPLTVVAGGSYTETIRATNTGNVPLNNVIITDVITRGNAAPVSTTFTCQTPLNPGQVCEWIRTINTTAADCPQIRDTVTATGQNACPVSPTSPNCPAPSSVTSNEASCTVQVLCEPEITVTKDVVCVPPSGVCDGSLSYSDEATGVVGAAFCYRITVTNVGTEAVNTIVVVDPNIPGVGSGFVGVELAPTESHTVYVKKSDWPEGTHVNTVTANATGTISLLPAPEVDDSATVTLLPLRIDCEIILFSSADMDPNSGRDGEGAADNRVTLPESGPVQVTIVLKNTGQAPLSIVSLSGLPTLVHCDDPETTVDVAALLPIVIGPGDEHELFLGCVFVECPQGLSFEVLVTAEATAEGFEGDLCIYDAEGNVVVVTNEGRECPAIITCQQPVTCRVTGGGRLDLGIVDPSCVDVETTLSPGDQGGRILSHVTHGGQLGAPWAQENCDPNSLGNRCIRGQWQHSRHYKGKGNPRDVISLNAHSNTPLGVFDTLMCACLPCCPIGEDGEPGEPVGGGCEVNGLCNPDDRKICGPLPRPAPANAIIFSGIGRIKPESDGPPGASNKLEEYIIFRVYIEDRSEPGGHHPKGAIEPSDIYCFQAWKTGILTAKKKDFTTVDPAFRGALVTDSCEFIKSLCDGGSPIGSLPSSIVDGRPADINDCGPLNRGNHQIHPSTKSSCTD